MFLFENGTVTYGSQQNACYIRKLEKEKQIPETVYEEKKNKKKKFGNKEDDVCSNEKEIEKEWIQKWWLKHR